MPRVKTKPQRTFCVAVEGGQVNPYSYGYGRDARMLLKLEHAPTATGPCPHCGQTDIALRHIGVRDLDKTLWRCGLSGIDIGLAAPVDMHFQIRLVGNKFVGICCQLPQLRAEADDPNKLWAPMRDVVQRHYMAALALRACYGIDHPPTKET